jgi:hypothetical protein
MSNSATQRGSTYLSFAIKTATVVLMASIGLAFSVIIVIDAIDMRAVKESLRKPFQDERARLRLKGLFTTNPAVHYKMSLLEEQRGRIGDAIEELELGIGLLELHSADKAVKERFIQRLNALKAKEGKGSR